MQIALFDQIDQPGAGLGDHSNVGGESVEQRGELGALQGARGGQHADHAAAGRGGRRLDGRLHADDGPLRVIATQVGDPRDRRGVTGQYQGLGALALKKLGHDAATLADEFRGFLAVGNVPTVAEVQQGFVRQQTLDLGQHRKPTDAGVEHADRRFTHAWAHRRCNPDHA
ncbi:hypothetical protein D3C76_748230 [compost metagenome]